MNSQTVHDRNGTSDDKLETILALAEPLDFLNELVSYGAQFRSATLGEFAGLPPFRRQLILLRAFYLAMEIGDFRDFLSEQVCGAFTGDLKQICQTIDANHAIRLIEAVEEAAGSAVPSQVDARFQMIEDLGSDHFQNLCAKYRASGEKVAELLRTYVRANKEGVRTTLTGP